MTMKLLRSKLTASKSVKMILNVKKWKRLIWFPCAFNVIYLNIESYIPAD